MDTNNDKFHQLYRKTSLGETLQATLDELVESKKMTENLKTTALEKFDAVVNQVLTKRAKARGKFKAGKLASYRFLNNTWTLILEDAEFKEKDEVVKTDNIKIVAQRSRF